jgi:mycothiol S-conjugate amidase
MGQRWPNEPGDDATEEERTAYEAAQSRMRVPDEIVTTRVDVTPWLDAKYAAIRHHVTQLREDHPFLAFGPDGWRDFWSAESFVLRDSRVPTTLPESDLFAGLT